jgi:hypothetical protein
VLECLRQTESHYVLENNQELIPPLIGHLQQNLKRLRFCDEMGLIHLAGALNEALITPSTMAISKSAPSCAPKTTSPTSP